MGGSITLNGRDITTLSPQQMRSEILGKEIAYIPQAAMNALNPTQKVGSFVRDLLSEHIPGITKKDALDMARERFESVRLPERVLHAYPVELSGGMKQRTVIALATLMDPKVLIADEPTSALDVTSQKSVIQLIRNLMEKGVVKSLVFITHELPLLYHVAEEILVMYAGEFVERGPRDQLVFDPIHPYSRALMRSVMVPEAGSKDVIPAAIPGAPPSLRTPPTGCRFFKQRFPIPIQQLAAQPANVVFICQFNHGIAEPSDVHYRHGPVRQNSPDNRVFSQIFQAQYGAPPLPVQVSQSLYFIREFFRESCPNWKLNDACSTRFPESILDSVS